MTPLFQRAFHLSQNIFSDGGVCLEFGVFKGDTYIYQSKYIKNNYPNSSVIGFDSWQGLPLETGGVWAPDRHNPGEFFSDKENVLRRLSELNILPSDNRFKFVDGFFSESLKPNLRDQISNLQFINIDVDLYVSTIELLDFVKPLLRPGVVIYWDDWKDPQDSKDNLNWGEHLAWDKWSQANNDVFVETIESNSINQRVMIVTEANSKKLTFEKLVEIKLLFNDLQNFYDPNADKERILEAEELRKDLSSYVSINKALNDKIKKIEERNTYLESEYTKFNKIKAWFNKFPLAKPIYKAVIEKQ